MAATALPTAVPAHHRDSRDPGSPSIASDNDELSEEQVQTLLKEAEIRLRSNNSRPNSTSFGIPKLRSRELEEPYLRAEGSIARLNSRRVVDPQAKSMADRGVRKVEDPVASRKNVKEEKKATAGPSWFDLPRTNLTPELKRDLQLLKMRSVLDPKRFYKKENGKAKPPEFSQVGTVIEGPTEYYSARLNNKDRKRTFADEVLAGEQETKRFKKKYDEIQVAKASGKKAHYKALKAKRAKQRR